MRTIGEYLDAIEPALAEILSPDELRSTRLRVVDGETTASREALLTDGLMLEVTTQGERHRGWVAPHESPTEARARVRSDLQDFVAESGFGWGQLRE